MILRKVSAKEANFQLIKKVNILLIEDFRGFAQRLTNQAGRSTKHSGKAVSYANTLIKLLVLYDEGKLERNKISQLTMFEIMERIIYIESQSNFKKFNELEGHFPSATIKCFIRYVEYKKVVQNNRVEQVKENSEKYTEVERKILQRIGQDEFKKLLINKYESCALCDLMSNYTIASHIKPWADSNDIERLDGYNGFLMCPNHDYLFDRGLVTIDEYGSVIVSKQVIANQIRLFNIPDKINIPIEIAHKKYLDYHWLNVYKN